MNQDKFIEEVEKLGLKVTSEKLEKLEKYYELLIEYNRVMNLTSITQKEDVYLKHFYDSLTITKIVDLNKEESLCDLGSGAGFPGIVIKIFFPNLKVVLVDSLNKRINFLNIIIEKLKLKNITAINVRIEDYSRIHKEEFDVVTARAVAQLNILLELGISLVKIGKYFIAMKGNIEKELNYENAIKTLNCKLGNILKFELPVEKSQRCLIKIVKLNGTSNLFPRKYNEIKKKPL